MNDQDILLQSYLSDYWEFILKNNPTFATYIGDHRYNDRLEDLSEESISVQIAYFRDILSKTEKIDRTLLTPQNRINCDLFRNHLDNHTKLHDFRTHYIPLNHMQGAHIDFPQIIQYHPFNTRQDIDNYISRLNAFPVQVDQVIHLLNKGIETGMTAFKKIMDHTLSQVETFTKFTPEQHPLFSPVTKIGEEFSEEDKEEITGRIKEALSSRVTPAYKKLFEYLSGKYINHCRDRAGVWSLPDGDSMYRFYTKYHTTTDLSPEEIHAIGKSEVERITGEIKTVMTRIGFSGTIREFASYVKNKKELFPKTGEEILDGYRNILIQMDKKLHEFFGALPKAKYGIKEIEKYREQAAPAAYYYPPPRDFSRPGYFYANTYMPEQRPKYEMEALSYHEAVPGHHLQIAIMQEQEGLPDFRRHEGSTAFIEGWALYAEKLAKEMGFYQNDFSEYGRLTFEIWRAIRLVVDTGLHFYKWTRDDAINYCKENSGLDDHEISVEVDRYIAIPGQALAYKIGELKILELKGKAEKSLGPKFDIKAFHDRLLENGALPLYVLEDVMK